MITIRSHWLSTASVLALLGFAREVEAQALTLAEALDRALAAHPAVAAADARVIAAEEAGDAARAARLPTAAMTASLTQFQEPMVVAPLHSLNPAAPPIFDRTLVQGQVGAQYTLYDGGARTWRIRGAEATGDAMRAVRTSAGMRVLDETTTAFLSTLTARALLSAASAQAGALEAERTRAQRHFDAGSAAAVEVLRAEAALQEALAAEATAQARSGLAERSLARLMGLDPNAIAGRELADPIGSGGSRPPGLRNRRRRPRPRVARRPGSYVASLHRRCP
jgi:outer membrane protein TolC